MQHHLAEARLPAVVLYQAVSELVQTEKWVSGTNEVLDRAKRIKARTQAAITLLEAPSGWRGTLRWELDSGLMTKLEIAREMARVERLVQRAGGDWKKAEPRLRTSYHRERDSYRGSDEEDDDY